MALDYVFPDSLELRLIAQDKLPRLTADRPIFDDFPMRDVDDWIVAWEQQDSYRGLQQLRGLNGAPPKTKKVGAKRYQVEPGVYGEFEEIDERELTRRRPYGQLGGQVDVSDLVMYAQDRLLGRRLDRMESIIWTLLTTGTFSVPTPTGGVSHTDSYTFQSYAASVAWSTTGSATPLMDFRNVKLKARGHSVDFGSAAKAYLNSSTANQMYSNTNSADLYGRRTQGLGTYNSPAQINQLLLGDNLPQIIEYDEGYLDDSGDFQLYIPTGFVIVVGRRPAGQALGEVQLVRNANNPGSAPGAYMKVIDRGEDNVPRSIEVHDGCSMAPALYFPSAVVVLDVSGD
jgi:hypothetical protein